MSTREFIALGTSSQAPTRERSHNAYLLLWDGEGFLLDPGEGAQRQLAFAGVPSSSINNICITHFHGDHCLGLAGIIQRLSLDNCSHPVHIYYPESGQEFIDRLCNAAIYQKKIDLIFHPIDQHQGQMIDLSRSDRRALLAHSLEHSVPTIGYRLEELASLRFLPKKLDEAHIVPKGRTASKGWMKRRRIVRGGSCHSHPEAWYLFRIRVHVRAERWQMMRIFSQWKRHILTNIGIS
jgi:ribonuclease Z